MKSHMTRTYFKVRPATVVDGMYVADVYNSDHVRISQVTNPWTDEMFFVSAEDAEDAARAEPLVPLPERPMWQDRPECLSRPCA